MGDKGDGVPSPGGEGRATPSFCFVLAKVRPSFFPLVGFTGAQLHSGRFSVTEATCCGLTPFTL